MIHSQRQARREVVPGLHTVFETGKNYSTFQKLEKLVRLVFHTVRISTGLHSSRGVTGCMPPKRGSRNKRPGHNPPDKYMKQKKTVNDNREHRVKPEKSDYQMEAAEFRPTNKEASNLTP